MTDYNDPEYYKTIPDAELQVQMDKWIPTDRFYQMGLKEQFRRRKEQEEKDRATQKSIKSMTLVILILTALSFIIGILGLIALFR